VTRRDYQLIARAIDTTDSIYTLENDDERVHPSEVIDFLIDALDVALQNDNPLKFDGQKFRQACVESRLKFYRDR
jgi:hypothetical protein